MRLQNIYTAGYELVVREKVSRSSRRFRVDELALIEVADPRSRDGAVRIVGDHHDRI